MSFEGIPEQSLCADDIVDGIWLAVLGVFRPSDSGDSTPPLSPELAASPPESAANSGAVKEDQETEREDDDLDEESGDIEGDAKGEAPAHPISAPAASDGAAFASAPMRGVPLKVPAATALPGARSLARALRPLVRRVPSRHRQVLDEEATVERMARIRCLVPAFRPDKERWLDLAIVVDRHASMLVWRETIVAFQKLCERLGAFRDVRVWRIDLEAEAPTLSVTHQSVPRSTRELIDATGRRVILLVSDCLAPGWRNGNASKVLASWQQHQPVAVVQVLPEPRWKFTAMRSGFYARVFSTAPAQPTSRYHVRYHGADEDDENLNDFTVTPVLTFERPFAQAWAQVVAGTQRSGATAFAFPRLPQPQPRPLELTAAQRVATFRAVASNPAKELATLFSAAVLRLPILRLVQQEFLPQSHQVHLAEVLLGGLMRVERDDVDPDKIEWEFHDGVRDALLDHTKTSQAIAVVDRISRHLHERFGQCLDFDAVLQDPDNLAGQTIAAEQRPFARVAGQVLARLGGVYAKAAAALQTATPDRTGKISFPELRKHRLLGKQIIWICKSPTNYRFRLNELLREQAAVTTFTSYEEAFTHINRVTPSAVICELGPTSTELHGFSFLDTLRRAGNGVHVLFYSRDKWIDRYSFQTLRKGAAICSSHWKSIRRTLFIVCRQPPRRIETFLPNHRRAALSRVLSRLGIPSANAALAFTAPQKPESWIPFWSRKQSPRTVIETAIKVARAVAGHGRQQLFVEDRGVLRLNATSESGASAQRSMAEKANALRKIVRHTAPLYVPDVLKTNFYLAADPTTRTEVVIPFPVGTGGRGLLSLETPVEHDLSARELLWLELFAGSIGRRLEVLRFGRTAEIEVLEEASTREQVRQIAFALLRAAYRSLRGSRNSLRLGEFGSVSPRTIVEFAEGVITSEDLFEFAWGHPLVRQFYDELSARFEPDDPTSRHHSPIELAPQLAFSALYVCRRRSIGSLNRAILAAREAIQRVEGAHLPGLNIGTIADEFKADLKLLGDRKSLEDLQAVSRASRPDLAPYPPRRRVLIAGTVSPSPRMDALAERVGRMLGAMQVGLIVGGWPGVDDAVIRGYRKRLAVGTDRQFKYWLSFSTDLEHRKQDRDATIFRAVNQADIVLAFEGGPGVHRIAEAARLLGKPLLGIGRNAMPMVESLRAAFRTPEESSPTIEQELLFHEACVVPFLPLAIRRTLLRTPSPLPYLMGSNEEFSTTAIEISIPEPVHSLTWHPSNNRLHAVGGRDIILDITRRRIRSDDSDHEGFERITWYRDGSRYVRWGGVPVLKYNIDDDERGTFELDSGAPIDVAWSASGHAFAVLGRRDVTIHSFRDGTTVFPLPDDCPPKSILWLSPRHVGVIFENGRLFRFTNNGEVLNLIDLTDEPITHACWIAETEEILVTTETRVGYLPITSRSRHPGKLRYLPTAVIQISPLVTDNWFAAIIGEDRRVGLFHAMYANRPAIMMPATNVRAIAWNPKGQLALATPRVLYVWNIHVNALERALEKMDPRVHMPSDYFL